MELRREMNVVIDRENPIGLRLEVDDLSILPHLEATGSVCLLKAKRLLGDILALQNKENGIDKKVFVLAKEALGEVEIALKNKNF